MTAAAMLLTLSLGGADAARAADPIAVLSQSVPLHPEQGDARSVGRLSYLGGVALRSPDDRFGGFSDLQVSFDGDSLLAISDHGTWLQATIRYDDAGRLAGLTDARMGPLDGPDGQPLIDAEADAEAMASLPDGSILVAFERVHRLLLYPPADPPFSLPPRAFPTPDRLARAPANGGIEALVHVGSSFLVAIAEKLRAVGGASAAWVGYNGTWHAFAYSNRQGFQPTGAALLEQGDIMVLERRYTPGIGTAVRLTRVAREQIRPNQRVAGREIASFATPYTIDNFEGIALRPGAEGETLVYLLSDDNFNPLQRTLLMLFRMEE